MPKLRGLVDVSARATETVSIRAANPRKAKRAKRMGTPEGAETKLAGVECAVRVVYSRLKTMSMQWICSSSKQLLFNVIPAKAGIQLRHVCGAKKSMPRRRSALDSRFRGNDVVGHGFCNLE